MSLTADVADGKTGVDSNPMQTPADTDNISGGSENVCIHTSHLQWWDSIATADTFSCHSRGRAALLMNDL